MALQAKRYSVSTYLKFFLFSAFGVFAFFINFNLPAYQIHIGGWEWGLVKAQSNVLCSHLTNFIKAALYTGNFKAMPFVVWAIGLYAVVDLFWLRPEKAWHTTKVNAAFAIFKIIGFIVLTMIDIDIYFGAHFGFMGWLFNGVDSLNGNSIANFVMANILVTICISIPCASLFLPFLVDYGLVDFIGVFVRVIMRPVFKLPGRAAIIMVTSANDTETVTSLFRHGVVDYLVKPFEYERFRSALERFSARMNVLSGTSGTVSQSDIDRLISPSSSGEPGKNTLAKGLNAPTLNLIRSFLKKHPEDSFTSEQISKEVNLSRITVRRYVNHMLEIGELTSTIDYQTGGRPGIHYKYCKV